MAEQEFINAVTGLSLKMDNFNQNLGTRHITPFDGDPRLFKRWVKAIEKHALFDGIPVERIKFKGFKTSTGGID